MLLDSPWDFFSLLCLKIFCLHLEIVLLSDASMGTLNVSLSILLNFVVFLICNTLNSNSYK